MCQPEWPWRPALVKRGTGLRRNKPAETKSVQKMLADVLLSLRADAGLALAAERGLITELACQMPVCICPQGRGYVVRKRGRNPWATSADLFPVPARDDGPLV